MKTEEVPTLPLTVDEYERLLDAVYVVVKGPQNHMVENQSREYWIKRVRGLFLLMRYSGLSIQDALTFPRPALIHDANGHRVVTQRTKTGTDVSVLLPPNIAAELLAVPDDSDRFFFWTGIGSPKSISGNWGKHFVAPCFAEAKITGGCINAHRLRDTFACKLLKAGVSLEHVSINPPCSFSGLPTTMSVLRGKLVSRRMCSKLAFLGQMSPIRQGREVLLL